MSRTGFSAFIHPRLEGLPSDAAKAQALALFFPAAQKTFVRGRNRTHTYVRWRKGCHVFRFLLSDRGVLTCFSQVSTLSFWSVSDLMGSPYLPPASCSCRLEVSSRKRFGSLYGLTARHVSPDFATRQEKTTSGVAKTPENELRSSHSTSLSINTTRSAPKIKIQLQGSRKRT